MNNFCSSCGVKVAKELRYCPLCGKYVAKNGQPPHEKPHYPIVDQSYAIIEKWIKLVRGIFILLAIISVAINLFFKTETYWFPYVLVGLFALWRILFYPFKEGKSHVASIPISGLVIALILVFIDVYDYNFMGGTLGWALCYSAPAVLTATTIVSFILALTNKNFEEVLTKRLVLLMVLEVLFLISKLLWFNQFKNWPIFMSLLASFVSLFLLFLFKRKRLLKELNRSFHI